MKNTTLLSSIFEDTKNLITSSEFKEAYSLGNSFSRNRKLSFSNTILQRQDKIYHHKLLLNYVGFLLINFIV